VRVLDSTDAYYQNLCLGDASMDGSTRPALSDASPALRLHDQIKILSSILHSLLPLSLPLLGQPSEGGGGAFMCREAKWITQARLLHFHSSGKSELPLDRDLTCVTNFNFSLQVIVMQFNERNVTRPKANIPIAKYPY
jgi:hypothetical protein